MAKCNYNCTVFGTFDNNKLQKLEAGLQGQGDRGDRGHRADWVNSFLRHDLTETKPKMGQ